MADRYWDRDIMGGGRNMDGGKWKERRHLSRRLIFLDVGDVADGTLDAYGYREATPWDWGDGNQSPDKWGAGMPFKLPHESKRDAQSS
jgi:hypothetical protein